MESLEFAIEADAFMRNMIRVMVGTMLEVAGGHATAAYHDGLMAFRTLPPPPLVAASLPDDGSLLGAAELCFDRIITDEGLQAWALADCPA